jgi:hypothetical protein
LWFAVTVNYTKKEEGMASKLREMRNGCLVIGLMSVVGLIFLARSYIKPDISPELLNTSITIAALAVLLGVATVTLCLAHGCHIWLRQYCCKK